MSFAIPLSKPDLSNLEKDYVNRALDSGWISSNGPFVKDFECSWAGLTDSKYSLAVSNGTVALHLVLAALGVGPGDEVIVPSLTFIASVNAIKYVGAKVVFADCNLETWCIDINSIKHLVNDKTKVVMAVDLYGNPCASTELFEFCEDRNIWLVEDAAEAPFGRLDGKYVGGISHVSTYSFFGNKVISSGEGGAISTSSKDLYEHMKLLRDHAMDPNRRYFFTEIGFNFRITNLQAAVLCAQVERLSHLLERRTAIYECYDQELSKIDSIVFQKVTKNGSRSPWLYTILVDTEVNGIPQIMSKLSDAGIETRPIFIPVHTLPPYSEHSHLSLPNSIQIWKSGLSLPTYSEMTKKDVLTVTKKLAEILTA
jgi:perosamine synthetase